MKQLNNLTLQVANQINNKEELNPYINMGFKSLSKFMSMTLVVLATSATMFSTQAQASDKYLPAKVTAALSAVGLISGNNQMAKEYGAATVGAGVGSQFGGGDTAPTLFGVLGAILGKKLAGDNINNAQVNNYQQTNYRQAINQGYPNNNYNNNDYKPNYSAPISLNEISNDDVVLYQVIGAGPGENYYITLNTSPTALYLTGNLQNENKKIPSKLNKKLEEGYLLLSNHYQAMEKNGVTLSQMLSKNKELYGWENVGYKDIPNFVKQYNQSLNGFYYARGAFYSALDSLVVQGYDVSKFSDVLQMSLPSENAKKLAEIKINQFPQMSSNNTKIRNVR